MSEHTSGWLPVARWELYRILRRRDFVLSVLATPVLLFAFSFLSSSFEHKGDHQVAVTRQTPDGAWLRGRDALPPLEGFTWVDPGAAGTDTSTMLRLTRARTVEAGVIVHANPAGDWTVDLVTRREPPRWTRELRDHLQAAARIERGERMGLDRAHLAALDDSIPVRSLVALGGRTGSRRADFLITFGVLMLTITVLLTSMSYMMLGISGEKQQRVTEVVLSAIPAQAWMDGKIIAFTAIGLIIGVVWTTTLLLIAGPVGFLLPGSINPVNLAITTVFAIAGLYFYNALISGLMASAQSMQTASRWQGNFIILPFMPIFFMVGLIENPDSPAMVVLSQLPFFSPSMIPARLVMGGVQSWEIGSAFVLLILGCWFMRQLAGRVFRIGMLMYGKDMTLPELIRWARVR